ncbi:MAG: NrtA/SsuA/CpmA family ABC transporter substrate-binding protein [Synergistaceae bacterium]|jgi:sulfonate transport system substrate-binding protein|nr:NrtA/SsuA/CpmA family ABC transporter substrate-binding protein [Synergistaceae bacterium]
MISQNTRRAPRALSLIFAAAVMFAVACPSWAAVPERLSVTFVPSPLNVPTIVETGLGMFQAAFPGTEIRLPEINAGPKQTEAMAAGEVDIAHCVGATSAILAASEGLDIRIIGIYSRAPRAFMIFARDGGIKTAADLKGKKIGGPKGTILHQLLAAYASSANLKETDYEFINMGIPAAAAALSNGSVDAALLAGADAYRAMEGGFSVVTDGVGLVDATTVIAATQKYLDNNADTVKRFLEMHAGALEYMGKNRGDTVRLTAEAVKLSAAAVEAMYGWYDFSTEISSSDVEELKRTQEFMLENKLQRNRIDVESIIAR